MDDNYPDVERRQYKRIKVNFTVVYRVDRPLQFRMMIGNRQVDALMLDLSEGGMSILTDCNLPIGAELSIRFTLIGAHPYDANRSITMEVTGEVRYNIIVRKNERRVGILFSKIGEKDKVTISNFVEKIFLNKS